MIKYKKTYCDYFGYSPDSYVPCEICSRPSTEVHHIVYKSQGGKDNIENLVGLCRVHHCAAHFLQKPYIYVKDLEKIHLKFLNKTL